MSAEEPQPEVVRISPRKSVFELMQKLGSMSRRDAGKSEDVSRTNTF